MAANVEGLAKRINSRLDEIWLTGDERAMKNLANEFIHIAKAWAHAKDRQARAKGDLGLAAVWARVAKELQHEAEKG